MVTVASGASAAAPQPPSGAPAPRMHTIDGLRFAAALGVLAYHWTARDIPFWGEPTGELFGRFGELAVYLVLAPELFFLISGFVVSWTAWGRTVPQFLASRLSRVFPTYWTAVALLAFLLLVVWPAGKVVSARQVLVNATLFQEMVGVPHLDGVYWTLWTELRFYALMAVFVAVGLTRRRVLAVAAVWPVVGVAAHHAGWTVAAEVLVGEHAPWFAMGLMLYLVRRDGHRLVPWLLVGLNLALALVTTVPRHVRSLPRLTDTEPSALVLSVLAVGCVVAVVALTLTPLARVPAPRLVLLGALTYPLYLTHQFWGWWVISLLAGRLPPVVVLVIAASVALVLAWAVHVGVERRVGPPVRRWLERTLTWRAGPADVVAVAR